MAADRIETPDDAPSPDEGPAVLIMDDGEQFELPEMTCGQAYEIWRTARETGALIGGEIDPNRVRTIGVRGEED